ncbi:MAG TPA: hypothetical protein PKN99_05990 [Cyclobacteriaceae bacterium]|nr:hypothetical protein [Cyclobacteriaceae bacterium]
MEAKDVKHSKFDVEKIIYETKYFAIAYGVWENRDKLLGFRWSGETNDDVGYPKLFGNPVWFVIPEELTVTFVKSLLDEKKGVKKDQIIELLRELL